MATPRAAHPTRHRAGHRAGRGRPRRARVRYERVTAALSACAVTLVAVLGGIGLLDPAGAPRLVAHTSTVTGEGLRDAIVAGVVRRTAAPADAAKFSRTEGTSREVALAALEVPPDGGDGKRIVFDQTAQRVWLVGADGSVRRTYPVSGSVDDNLDPGSYEVYSRSERAWGIDDGGTMRFMVRFAHGERAAIGFHDIPYKDGELVQTRAELGTALSSGCIRQARPDAKALWAFAPVGTSVVVVA